MTDKNILQRYEERRKRIAEQRMLEEEAAKKRAYAAARQIVRKKAEEKAGADYEQLGPTQRETVDKAVADKELVKKVALRLLPKFSTGSRDSSFTHGTKLDNHGSDERQHPAVHTFGGSVKEANDVVQNFINDKFSQNFKKGEDSANTKGGKKEKGSPVVQYSKFGEQVYDAIERKSAKSGIDVSILGEVFVRGLDSHPSTSRITREQYAFARVNSFISKGKTYYNEDSDLAEEVELEEKHLTPAEMKKREEIAKAMERENPGMPMGKKMAIATAQAKKVAEEAEIDEGREPGKAYVKPYHENGKHVGYVSSTKWGKKKWWRNSEGGIAKAKAHAGVDTISEEVETLDEISKATLKSYSTKAEKQTRGNQPHGADALRKRTNREKGLKSAYHKYYGYKTKVSATEEVEQTNENFIDGKGPGKPGDAAHHGLKGKSATELRKIRSSETASPRTKQLAHWMLNMHHNEETDLQERGLWDNIHAKRKRIKAGSGEHMRKPGSKGAPTKQDFIDAQEETNSELRTKVTAVARSSEDKMRKHVGRIGDTEQKLTRQGEIKNKIIDEEGNCQPDASKRLIGTDSLVNAFKTDTPGQAPNKIKKAVNESLNESFNIAYAAGIGQTYTAADLGMTMQGAFAHHPDTIKEMEEIEMEEDVVSKTKSPVIIPPIRKDDGTYTPAKTVLRTTGKKIIKGDPNVTDGQ